MKRRNRPSSRIQQSISTTEAAPPPPHGDHTRSTTLRKYFTPSPMRPTSATPPLLLLSAGAKMFLAPEVKSP
jgi:hypothetical protein